MSGRHHITISPVGMNPNEQLAPTIKFPGGHIANILPEHQALMERAAKKLKYVVTFGAARNAINTTSIGVYVASYEPDPKYLVQEFNLLKVDAFLAAQKSR